MKMSELVQVSESSQSDCLDLVSESLEQQSGIRTGIEDYYVNTGLIERTILRKTKDGSLKKGFRCMVGPRKGRIVANPATCFAKRNVSKGAKISKKRMGKAKQMAIKRSKTLRTSPASVRLKNIQVNRVDRSKSVVNPKKAKPMKTAKKTFQKSKVVKK